MIVRDALYGAFELPRYLEKLVLAPEFRRLSEVRLININSVTLSSLADVRRYSHTLGVVRLALLNPLLGLSEPELKAFLASIIVHDAGTPAFAHLFEYFLLEQFKWDHESMVAELLLGESYPDDRQIHASLRANYKKLCEESGIEFDLVLDFVTRRHRWSQLIFGTLDFDNLDNVARMNWMMGERFDLAPILSIAAQIGVDPAGRLELPETERTAVQHWQRLRAQAYNILIFDGPSVAGQAVLSKTISEALDQEFLADLDWKYNDADLLRALCKHPETKKRLHDDFYKELPSLRLLYVEKDNLGRFEGWSRETIAQLVETFLWQKFKSKSYGYVFRDKGAFSKRLDFVDPTTKSQWSVGDQSASLIIYGFLKGKSGAHQGVSSLGEEFRGWIDSQM